MLISYRKSLHSEPAAEKVSVPDNSTRHAPLPPSLSPAALSPRPRPCGRWRGRSGQTSLMLLTDSRGVSRNRQAELSSVKTSKNVGHVCQSAACVILEQKELQRRHLSDLERLDPSGHPKTSDTYAKTQKCLFVTLFFIFSKNIFHKKSLLRFGIRVRRFLVF